jgi:hypothetical protein
MKAYIVYHYYKPDVANEWQNTLFDKPIPLMEYVSNDRAKAIEYADSMGGLEAGYFVAMCKNLDITE